MQAVLFISMFSLIFLMFSSMTAGLSKNIMQENIEKVQITKNMFKEIENAVNVIAYRQKEGSASVVDLTNDNYTLLDGTFIAENVSYSATNLKKDLWGRDIKLFKHTDSISIWSGGAGQIAKAPITTFLLISAGPNRRYDTFNTTSLPVTLSESQIKTTDISNKNLIKDDIVIRFDNYDVMYDIWYKAESLDNLVENISYEYYKARLDAFAPLIHLGERDGSVGSLKDNVFENDDVTDDYDPFDTVLNVDANNWNDTSSGLYSKLQAFRYSPKTYSSEFNVSSDIYNEFKSKYGTSREYIFPAFDAVQYDDSGNVIANSTRRGLQNLGLPNLYSLDPFNGTACQLDYEYNRAEPNKLKIKRDCSVPGDKWEINKVVEIDGLGG